VCTLLPREGLDNESQLSNYPDATTVATYDHARA